MTRFSAFERALHWLLALTFLTMAATGLILYLPSLAEVAANRGMWKSIHLGAAIAFWAGLIALLPGNGRQFRASAREIDRFDGDDRRWLQWAVTRRGDEPVQGRFNAGQKLNTAIVSALMVVFTVSGTLMYLQETDASLPRPNERHPRARPGHLGGAAAGRRPPLAGPRQPKHPPLDAGDPAG